MSADYTDEDLRLSLKKCSELGLLDAYGEPMIGVAKHLAAFRAEARREEREANFTLLHEASGLKLSLNDMLERAHEQGRMMERQSEREACERIVVDWIADTCEWLLRMNVTADPGADEPKNFEPDKRTRVAVAAWLLDQRKEELLRRLRERAR